MPLEGSEIFLRRQFASEGKTNEVNICFVQFSLSKVLVEVNNFFFLDRVTFLHLGEGTGRASGRSRKKSQISRDF